MIDLSKQAIILRQKGLIKGIRPLFINILKGDYPYKGNYLLTIEDDCLHFYQLKRNYDYAGKKARDFLISFDKLSGFRYAFYKPYYKKITLIFKDELEFCFIYVHGYEEAYDNEPNALALMKVLKEKHIYQQNNLKGGLNVQRTISKTDQFFTQEVRSPSKKRGLFR